MRWGSGDRRPASVRLEDPSWENPVYLEEVLTEGGLDAWEELYRQIRDKPFGPTATVLEKVLSRVSIYGVTPLWTGLLRTVRGGYL